MKNWYRIPLPLGQPVVSYKIIVSDLTAINATVERAQRSFWILMVTFGSSSDWQPSRAGWFCSPMVCQRYSHSTAVSIEVWLTAAMDRERQFAGADGRGFTPKAPLNKTFARYYMGAVCFIADHALEGNTVCSLDFAADASGWDLHWHLSFRAGMGHYELRKRQYLGKPLVLNSAAFGKAAVQDSNPSPKKSDRQSISAAVRPWRSGHQRILARAQWRSAL